MDITVPQTVDSWYEYWYRGTTVLACDARVVPVDLAYVIFIDFLALGVLGFCFLLLSNVQFLVLVNLPQDAVTQGGFVVDIVDDDILHVSPGTQHTLIDPASYPPLAWPV